MRRRLLIVALGISFLILITWLGTIVTNIVPRRATAQTQTAQAGPYQVTLQVNPNPPLITQPATLSVQVLLTSTQQPVNNAHVTLESNMETMDMGSDRSSAQLQNNGTYLAHVQFTMSGPWQVRVIVEPPGASPVNVVFEVAAQ